MRLRNALLTTLLIATTFGITYPGGASPAFALAPGENLVQSGVPEIPDELVEKANRYTEVRHAHLLSWHPTRTEMLIATRFCDTSQVHSLQNPYGVRKQLTFFKDSIHGASYEPTEGSYFVFSKDVGGSEKYQKYRYDILSGDITLLTDGESRNTGGSWSNDGKWLAFESNERNKKDMDICIMDPKDPSSRKRLAELQGGGFNVLDWSPDDKTILAIEEISINESKLWLFDVATGKKTLIAPPSSVKEKVAYLGGEFSKDGKGIYTATDKDSEFLKMTYIDLESNKYTQLAPSIDWDVEDFDLSWDGKKLAFVTNEDGLSKLHIFDVEANKELEAPKLPVGLISYLKFHKNNEELGYCLETAKSPDDVYTYNVRTGLIERWTESETGGLNTFAFNDAELIKWKSFDGKMISGYLWRPPSKFTGKRPVAIYIHGGPESQSRPGFLGKLNYHLNELGIAIIMPNVRGSAGYGKTFLTLDNGLKREDSYKDINALLDWVAKEPDLDSERVLVAGGSYGGFMTLAVATNYPERIRAAQDVVGPSNLVTFLERTEDYRRDLRRVEYGDERDPKVRAYLESIAPRNKVDKIKAPLFVVQGKNDPRVPWQESQEMVDVLAKKGMPVWFLMANDEGHGFSKKQNNDYYFYTSLMFIQKHLVQ